VAGRPGGAASSRLDASHGESCYDEVRAVGGRSPRAAIGLLRLALQLLVDELEPGGGSIDHKIGKLVQRGLAERVQKAMDTLRVVGNEAVPPGTIGVDDPKMLAALFEIHNIIVQQIVADAALVDDLYAQLPPAKLAGIASRDSTKALKRWSGHRHALEPLCCRWRRNGA